MAAATRESLYVKFSLKLTKTKQDLNSDTNFVVKLSSTISYETASGLVRL